MATISIIIPVYNAEHYLHYCVDSILAQTITDFELILVNDGSKDDSGALCDEYAKKDVRIKVLHQANQGQAVARNRALDIAEGEYIAFVDSDDYIHPLMYEVLLNNAKKSNALISVCCCEKVHNHTYMPEIKEEDKQFRQWEGFTFLTHCLLNGIELKPWILCDKLFHRSCFENVRMPEGRINEDNAIVYKIVYEAETIADCDAPFYYYYQNPDSTVNQTFKKKHLDWLLVPQEMMEYFAEKQDKVLLDKANKMYLHALEDMYKKVELNLQDKSLLKELKGRLYSQYQKEKKHYPISIKTHAGLYEILYPKYSFVYWTAQGILQKFRRE